MMVQTDFGNVLFGTQQKYNQLVFIFFLMTSEVILKKALITMFTQHTLINPIMKQQNS